MNALKDILMNQKLLIGGLTLAIIAVIGFGLIDD